MVFGIGLEQPFRLGFVVAGACGVESASAIGIGVLVVASFVGDVVVRQFDASVQHQAIIKLNKEESLQMGELSVCPVELS